MKSLFRLLAARHSAPAPTAAWVRLALPVSAICIAASFLAPAAMSQAQTPTHGPTSVADIAARLQNAVVNIATTQKLKESRDIPMPDVPEGSPFEEYFQDFFNKENRGGGQRASSLGSGFVIDPEGLIVTNNHVIEGADEIQVILTDGEKLKVLQVVGRDSKTDLALLRVKPKAPLPAVKFGDSGKMRVGDWVMAIGNPFGLGGTLTVGVISATRRDINSGNYDEFLQTDAAINRGNSGGPLFNMEGEVIGVNTAIISPTGGSIGIGFAIPSDTVSHVLGQLKQFGETRRGWLGVRIQTVTDEIAESVGLKTSGGALIASVTPDGPAAAAGVQVGDVILSFDGTEITAMHQLPKVVAQATIGKEVEIVVLRKDQRLTLKAKVGRLEEEPVKPEAKPDEKTPSAKPEKRGEADQPVAGSKMGLTFAPMTDELRTRFKIDREVNGVVITEVDPDSTVADADVKAGDVVVEVTHEKVNSPADIEARFEALRKLQRRSALLTLSDGQGQMSFVAVTIASE